MDGAPLMAQCVEHGHWNKPPKEWGDAPSLESPLAAVRRVAPDRETVARILWESRYVAIEWDYALSLTENSGLVARVAGCRKDADALLASGVLGVPADATGRTEYALDYRAGIMCASDERADAEEMQQFIPDSFIVRRTVTETEWEPAVPDEGSDRA
jgi:hypothetical protein